LAIGGTIGAFTGAQSASMNGADWKGVLIGGGVGAATGVVTSIPGLPVVPAALVNAFGNVTNQVVAVRRDLSQVNLIGAGLAAMTTPISRGLTPLIKGSTPEMPAALAQGLAGVAAPGVTHVSAETARAVPITVGDVGTFMAPTTPPPASPPDGQLPGASVPSAPTPNSGAWQSSGGGVAFRRR
jgi:hypothetical protein